MLFNAVVINFPISTFFKILPTMQSVHSTSLGLDNVTTTVLNIKNINPVDLSDFWTTESMGVQIDPCVCDASKLSQLDREEKIMIEHSAKKVRNQ